MDMFTMMESKKDAFSKTDRLIYNSINKFPDEYASLSINKIIEKRGFSQPSLTRFAKKLGFSGFNEFQYQFRRDLFENPSPDGMRTRSEIYADQLKLADQFLTDELLEEVTNRILNSSSAYFYGTSLSRMPSEFLAESLRILGVHGVQALPVDAVSVPYRNTDLFLCFSAHSGHYCTDVVRQLSLTDEKPHSILVTMNPKHPLRKSFDQIIALPQAPSSGGTRMILNDTMAFMMFVDRITNLITKKLFPAPDEQ